MGFKFADAPGQTDYQYVGDELKKLMQAEIEAVGDPAASKGKTGHRASARSASQAPATTVPRAKPVNVQPVTLEVG